MFIKIIIILYCFDLSANNNYTVKVGDTLSEIVSKNTSFKIAPLYTKSGRLSNVLRLNPHLQNPDQIFVGEVILLIEIESKEKIINKPVIKNNQINIKKNKKNKELKRKWEFGFSYGASFINYDQSGIIGTGVIQQLMWNYISYDLFYHIGNYSFGIIFNEVDFNLSTNNRLFINKLKSFLVSSTYKNFLIGIGRYQLPIIKNQNGVILQSVLNVRYLKLKYNSIKPFSIYKNFKFTPSLSLGIPITMDSKNLDIDLIKFLSYKIDLGIKFSKNMFTSKKYNINLILPLTFTYNNISSELSWNTAIGSYKNNIMSFDSSIGLDIILN